ncbi:MAG: TolC family protein, partial [Candidatus Hydrogenedentes bacterium]|nr:TolC family protein [Candidatus Hydrogenedentota bacterium]
RRSLETLTAAQQELLIQRETTQFVERNRELVEREYRSGQGSLVRLNEAQRDLIAQRGRLALARVVLRQSWFDLKTATGETLESIVD